MIKGTTQNEDITLVNVYAPNIGGPKYIKQILIKREIDSNTVIVGDFNTLLTLIDRPSRHKTTKKLMALNETLHQMDLIDICIAFHPKATEYTYFTCAQATFSKIDNIPAHNTSLRKFKKIEIITSIFSGHNTKK